MLVPTWKEIISPPLAKGRLREGIKATHKTPIVSRAPTSHRDLSAMRCSTRPPSAPLPELNKAYAHIAEPVFTEAAKALVDKLVQMGFDDSEARENIESPQYELDADGLFAPRARAAPVFRQKFATSPEAVETLRKEAGDAIAISATEGDEIEVFVTGYLAPEVEAAILRAVPDTARGDFSEAASTYRAEVHPSLSPSERGEAFHAPALPA